MSSNQMNALNGKTAVREERFDGGAVGYERREISV
jgi:hypothetical protein